MRGRQALRLLGVSVMACVALGAFAASAQAGTWIVEGKELKEGVDHPVTCNRAVEVEKLVVPFTLTGTVGSTPVKIEFGKVECVKEAFVIFDQGGVAYSEGKFHFSEGKILEPTGCSIGEFTTEPITGQVKEYAGLAPNVGITYSPKTVGGNWATMTITGTCAAAGNRIMKGFTVAQIVPGIFEEGKIPEYKFSPSIETATGSELKFAGNAAHLAGALKFFF